MSKVTEVSEALFETEVEGSDVPVLVDFYAPWCGPCKMLAPMLDALSAEYAGRVKFVKINVDHAGGLANRFGITGVPTLVLLKGKLVLATMVGIPSLRTLKGYLDQYASQVSAPAVR